MVTYNIYQVLSFCIYRKYFIYREKCTVQYKIPEKHKRKKLALKNITISFFLKRFKRFFIGSSNKSFLEIEYLDDCDLQ